MDSLIQAANRREPVMNVHPLPGVGTVWTSISFGDSFRLSPAGHQCPRAISYGGSAHRCGKEAAHLRVGMVWRWKRKGRVSLANILKILLVAVVSPPSAICASAPRLRKALLRKGAGVADPCPWQYVREWMAAPGKDGLLFSQPSKSGHFLVRLKQASASAP